MVREIAAYKQSFNAEENSELNKLSEKYTKKTNWNQATVTNFVKDYVSIRASNVADNQSPKIDYSNK